MKVFYLTTLSVAKTTQPRYWINKIWVWRFCRTKLKGKTDVVGETPVQMPLCPRQILHGLAWDRNLVSAARGRHLTINKTSETKCD